MKRLGIDDKQLTPRSVLSQHFVGQEPHARSAGGVPRVGGPQDRSASRTSTRSTQQELAKSNALDFDDLLLYAVRVLKASGDVRERYNRRYRHILVDEYQDTNRPQYELMRMLAGKEHNVCAVGDEDQSIYSWRGADIRNILEFEKDFPEARSSAWNRTTARRRTFCRRLRRWWRDNVKRKGKNLWTDAQRRRADRLLRSSRRRERGAVRRRLHRQVSAPGAGENGESAARGGAVSHQLAVAPVGRGHAPLRDEVPRCGRLQLLRARRDQGHDLVPEGSSRIPTTRSPCSASSTRRRAASARPPWRRWSGSRWRPASPCGARSARRSTANCFQPRALAALKNFKRAHRGRAGDVSGNVCASDVARDGRGGRQRPASTNSDGSQHAHGFFAGDVRRRKIDSDGILTPESLGSRTVGTAASLGAAQPAAGARVFARRAMRRPPASC